MSRNYLLDLLDEREEQPEKTAPVSRSIDSEEAAWDQALKDKPSTHSQSTHIQQDSYEPAELWNPENIKSSTRKQPEVNLDNPFIQKAKPIEYNDAFLKQEEEKDKWSPLWDNGKPISKIEPTEEVKNSNREKAGKIGKLLYGVLEQGSGVVVQGVTSLMDNLFGGLAQEIHTLANQTLDSFGIGKSGQPLGEKNLISAGADWVRDTNKKEADYYAKNASELGKAGEAVNKYGTSIVAAAPAAILALATGGGSAAGMTTQGLQSIAASELSGTSFGYYTNAINQAMREMASTPGFQLSFAQEAGHAYDEAIADGASESEAALYSLLYATPAAIVEVGGSDEALGGLQKLPDQLRKAIEAGDKSTVLKIAKSVANEIGEENIQGILEAGLKSTYQETPLQSVSPNLPFYGENNAIIDPERMKEEAKSAGITSLFLGGAQDLVTRASSARSNPLLNSAYQEQANAATPVETQNTIANTAEEESPQNAPQSQETSGNEFIPAEEEKKLNSNVTQNTGTAEVFSGDQVPTQSNIHDQYTEEEAARAELNPENDTHTQHHDAEVEEFASNRIQQGAEQARSDLLSRNPESWDDVDVRTAQKILEDELNNARSLEGEEQDAAYARIAELKDAYNKQGTAAGQSLRQRQNFTGTKTEVVSEAANVLFGPESAGKLRNMSPEQKANVMKSVEDYSDRLSNISNDDSAGMISLIESIADTRKTKPLFDPKGDLMNKALEAVSKMDGGMEWLRNLATTQTRSIAGDYVNPGIINKLKAVRYMNMLSNPATASRNVGANTVFGTFIDAVSNNASIPADALMSLATGKKTTSFDRSLSPEAIKGSVEAGLKSWLEVSLDAEAEQASYAYNEIKGRTFKANANNFIERFLSSLERNQGYQLKTTDQLAKGGIEAETAAGLERIGVNQKEALDLAKEEAKYRTLQNESKTADVAKGFRNSLNKLASVKDKQGGSYGLGDDILPFAQVPANVVKTELDLNPLSAIPAAKKVFDVMVKGENATIQEQRSAAKAFGRALNGTAMVALSAMLSSQGIIRYTDDDDPDLKQLHKAQGKSGLQINASAALRFLTGQGSEETSKDKWISLGWLPQLNSLMIIGNMIYDDYKDMPEQKTFYDYANLAKKGAIDSAYGMYESLMEFPAVSTISSLINAYKYADVDKNADKKEQLAQRVLAVGEEKLGNTATGFLVPNALRGVAAGLDDSERDLYTQQGELGQAVDYVKAGIPGLRETLPEMTDNYGNPIKNSGGVQQFLNKTILPGAITEDNDSPLLAETERLATETGNMDVVPNKNGKSSVTVNGSKYELTPTERRDYQITAGQVAKQLTEEFRSSPEYQEMDDATRADITEAINKLSLKYADSEVDKARGGTGLDINLETAVQDQINTIAKKTAKNDVDAAVEEGNVNLLLESLGAYSDNGGSARNVLLSEAKKGGFIKDGSTNDEGIVNYLLNASASDEEIDNAVSDYGTKGYKATYSAAREAGASPKEASEIISSADGYGEKGKDNGSLTQAELKAYASDNPGQEAFIRAIWDAQGWSKDFDGNKYAG